MSTEERSPLVSILIGQAVGLLLASFMFLLPLGRHLGVIYTGSDEQYRDYQEIVSDMSSMMTRAQYARAKEFLQNRDYDKLGTYMDAIFDEEPWQRDLESAPIEEPPMPDYDLGPPVLKA
jgi:hypothetical protein